MKALTLLSTASKRGKTQSGAVQGASAINGGFILASGRSTLLVTFCGMYGAVRLMHALSSGKSGVYRKPSMLLLPLVFVDNARMSFWMRSSKE